jgi:hypothetical protein
MCAKSFYVPLEFVLLFALLWPADGHYWIDVPTAQVGSLIPSASPTKTAISFPLLNHLANQPKQPPHRVNACRHHSAAFSFKTSQNVKALLKFHP